MLVQLKCKSCNAILNACEDSNLFKCEYCGDVYIWVNEGGNEILLKESDASGIRSRILEQKKQQALDDENRRKQEAQVELRAYWIRSNRCRHCGGAFEGRLFNKHCKKCMRKKDYWF